MNPNRRVSSSELYLMKQTIENIYRRLARNPIPIIKDRKSNMRTFSGVDLVRCVMRLLLEALLNCCFDVIII